MFWRGELFIPHLSTLRLRRLPARLLLIRRMQIEINPAQGTVILRLAENDRYLPVQRDPVPQMRPAVLVRLDRFLHQRPQRRLAFLRSFVDAHDKLVVDLYRIRDFVFEGVDRHAEKLGSYRANSK